MTLENNLISFLVVYDQQNDVQTKLMIYQDLHKTVVKKINRLHSLINRKELTDSSIYNRSQSINQSILI